MNRNILQLAQVMAGLMICMGGDILAQNAAPFASPGPARSGPDILYAPPASSPQLENTGVWTAPPILVSGVTAYRNGEFLYQDFLYDDRGALGRATYPAGKSKYAGNAADFVELRLKPLADATAIRITFNSMLEPALVGTTIALGGDASKPMAMPFGANARMPAAVFATVHGTTVELTDPGTGGQITGSATATVDLQRRQVEVRIPYAVFDPRGKSVRIAAATGLWNQAANSFMMPEASAAGGGRGRGGPSGPGGASGRGAAPIALPAAPTASPLPTGSVFFNVAFRSGEAVTGKGQLVYWSDEKQSAALATGDLAEFHADVDFAKLAARVNDDSAIPVKGFMDRILVSHFESAQGRGNATALAPESCPKPCIPEYAGRLVPYSIYVPARAPAASGYGLTLDIHSASANYNRWLGHERAIDFGERGTGSIVVTPNGRGVGTWYYGEAEAEVFEIWADVARRYKIDPDYVTLAGISMGGFGSWKIAAQFPDLFAAEALGVPCPALGMPGGAAFDHSYVGAMVSSLRYVPAILFTGEKDTTCRLEGAKGERETMAEYARLGLRYDWYIFLTMPHAMSGVFPHYKPMVEFLGTRKRTVDPAHVTFVHNASMDEPEFGIVADHAYWLSGIRNRDAAEVNGSLDVVSHGIGMSDAPVLPKVNTTGTFDAGVPNFPWPNYTLESIAWGKPAARKASDAIDVNARNVAAVTIDPARAKVSCNATVSVHSDGPIQVSLTGCAKPHIVTVP